MTEGSRVSTNIKVSSREAFKHWVNSPAAAFQRLPIAKLPSPILSDYEKAVPIF